MGILFDSETLVDHESNHCISCNSVLTNLGCVKCKAKGFSTKATAVLLTMDDDGYVNSIQEVWIH